MKRKIKFETIILGIIAFLQMYPLIWLLMFSLKSNKEIFGGNPLGLPKEWLWSNYSDAIFNGKVGVYFINSIIVTVVTIVVSNILASMVAFGIARLKWKLKNHILILFLIGLMIPMHATLLPLFIFLKKVHLYNTYGALILPYIGFALPMAIYIMTGFFKSIPKEIEEAACLDGCSIYRIFYHIMLPLVKPAIATVSIFTYLSCWNELMYAITFISKQEYKTLTVGIMSLVGQYVTNWGTLGAGLVVSTIPILIIYILMSGEVQKSFTTGALKG